MPAFAELIFTELTIEKKLKLPLFVETLLKNLMGPPAPVHPGPYIRWPVYSAVLEGVFYVVLASSPPGGRGPQNLLEARLSNNE